MSVQYKVGTKLKSAVCDAQFILLRGPVRAIDLRIGGAAALTDGETKPEGATLDPWPSNPSNNPILISIYGSKGRW